MGKRAYHPAHQKASIKTKAAVPRFGYSTKRQSPPANSESSIDPTAFAGIQAKRDHVPAHDPLEHEADVTADRIVGMSGPAREGAVSTGQASPTIARKTNGAAPVIADAGRAEENGAAASSNGLNLGAGHALPDGERRFFESRFQRGFGSVRIHTDGDAARMAERQAARAFTLGRHVVFGKGEYRPGTTEGRRLLAHELTHTLQQQSGLARHLQKQTAPQKIPTHPLDALFLNGTRVRRYAEGKVMYVETVLPPGILQDIIVAPRMHNGASSAGILRTIASHPPTANGFDRTRVTVKRGAYSGGGQFNFADGHFWTADPAQPGEAWQIRSKQDDYGEAYTIVDFRGKPGNLRNAPPELRRDVVNIGYYETRSGQNSGPGRLVYVERYDYLDSTYLGSVQGGPGSWTWNPQAQIPSRHAGLTWRQILQEQLTPANAPGMFHELIEIDAQGNFDDSDRPYRFP